MPESLSGMDGMFRAGLLDKEWNWSRHVFESVANGITISDAIAPDLPLIYANPAFTQLTGYPKEEFLGQNCRFLQGSDTQQAGLAVLRQALRTGTEVRTVLRNYCKDGSLFWNELYMSPIRDREGRLTHYVGIQNDVRRALSWRRI
jgi:two-component system sporulation sensor kinase C